MNSQETRIRLDGELTIYQVAERHEELRLAFQTQLDRQASGEQPQLTIDTGELTEVDSAGLQLLIQWAHRARQADLALDWLTPSAALTQIITLYNAQQWFNAPAEAHS
jgi:ABC-type transporter Mla MlaB component